jgi:signal transduction histidine kinase
MSAAAHLFESFFANQGFALFEYLGDGEFQLIGTWPAWCQALWGDLAAAAGKIRIGDASPFLENFIFDAEQFWDSKSAAGSANSGNWTEREASGREIPLEASAYFLDGRRVLVVRNLSETFDQQQEIFQTARDSLLVYEKLLREIQKKEILLHCIVHDLTQPLSAMNSVFHLLDREHLSPQLKKYVKTGERESQRQELMIRGILEAFSSDLAAQNSKQEKAGEAPDLADCAQRAVRDFSTPFRDHDVGLRFGTHLKKSDGLARHRRRRAHRSHLRQLARKCHALQPQRHHRHGRRRRPARIRTGLRRRPGSRPAQRSARDSAIICAVLERQIERRQSRPWVCIFAKLR